MGPDDMNDEDDLIDNTVDDALEQTRQNNQSVSVGSEPLPGDYDTPAAPSTTGSTDDLVADDHPSRDTDVEISEDYNDERS